MININIPTEKVLNLKSQGLGTAQIIATLQKDRYTQQQIADALAQANLKIGVGNLGPRPPSKVPYPPVQGYQESEPMPPEDFSIEIPEPPSPPTQAKSPEMSKPRKIHPPEMIRDPRGDLERIEEISESIIQEKWEEVMKNIGNIPLWKEKVNTEILSIKQEVIRTQQRFDNLEKAILGKISRYDDSVRDLGSEMKALEKVFERILTPLTTNIKELTKITNDLKKTKK